MRVPRWRRAMVLTAMCSTIALGACATDPVTGSVPADPSLPKDEQPIATAERLMRLGDAALAAGDPRTAVGFYRRAVDIDSKNYPVLVQLAGALNQMGAYDEAIETYQDALKAAPRDPEALRGLGNALLASNRPQLAREQFQTALEVSDDPRLYSGLGVTLDMTGDHAAAQSYYRLGLEQEPEDVTLRNNLGLSLSLSGKHGEAIDVLRGVVADPRASVRHRQNLVMAYGLAGRTDEARELAARDLGPDQVEDTLAFIDMLRASPEPAKHLLGSSRERFAARRAPEETPPQASSDRRAVAGPEADAAPRQSGETTPPEAYRAPPASRGTTPAEAYEAPRPDAGVPPLPAPVLDPGTLAAAKSPAALPPIGAEPVEAAPAATFARSAGISL